MFHLKRQIDGQHPSLDVFSGRKPVRLLEFLTTLRDTFDTIRTSEAGAVCLITYFLYCESKVVHSEQFAFVESVFDGDSPNGSGSRNMVPCSSRTIATVPDQIRAASRILRCYPHRTEERRI